MANTGNVFAGTGENNAGIGATAWTTPGNVTADDATDTTCAAAASSQYLVARNFAFSAVPTNATINGVLLRVEASEHSGGTEPLLAQLQDNTAALFGSSKSTSNQGSISGTAKAMYTYGSIADLWGATITPAIVHSANFGGRFWFTTAHDVRIDFVTGQLEYTVPVPGIAAETSTAITVAVTKLVTTKIATETSAALTVTATKLVITGLAAESSAAIPVAASKLVPAGMAAETDTALAPTVASGGGTELPTGVALETDAGLGLGAQKVMATGLASDPNTALALQAVRTLGPGLVAESETAFRLSVVHLRSMGLATEAALGLVLSMVKVHAIGMSLEAESAVAAALRKMLTLLPSLELDSAFALSSGSGGVSFQRGEELDVAFSVALSKHLPMGVSVDVASAFSLAFYSETLEYSGVRGCAMPTVAVLMEMVWEQLENRALYPPEEVCANGLNPAMRLLCLMDPTLFTQRITVTLPAQQLTVDLRVVAPRSHRVLRVLLGTVASDLPTPASTGLQPLQSTSRERLGVLDPQWLIQVGVPRRWFMLGRQLLALSPRPVADMPLTLVVAASPEEMTVSGLQVTPPLDIAYHPLLADLATALLLCKEGQGESDRAVRALADLIGAEAFAPVAKRYRERMAQAVPLAEGDSRG